jgi:hypothetical protein
MLGDCRVQFFAKSWGSYHGAFIGDRKHWERGSCRPTFTGHNSWGTPRGADIVFCTRKGRHVVMRPPVYPRKGTVMLGSMSGYYEPEWEEECAWNALENLVRNEFMDCDENGENWRLTRTLASPSDILRAAEDLIAQRTRKP